MTAACELLHVKMICDTVFSPESSSVCSYIAISNEETFLDTYKVYNGMCHKCVFATVVIHLKYSQLDETIGTE